MGSCLKTGLPSRAWLRVKDQEEDAVHHVWQVTEGVQRTGASRSWVLSAFLFFFYSLLSSEAESGHTAQLMAT